MSKQDAVKKYKAAKAALHAYSERELKAARARGQKDFEETEEYRRLNKAVLAAEKTLPWILR